MDCSLPGSSVLGILQARILELVGIPVSWGSSQVSWIGGRLFTIEPPGKSSDWRGLFHCLFFKGNSLDPLCGSGSSASFIYISLALWVLSYAVSRAIFMWQHPSVACVALMQALTCKGCFSSASLRPLFSGYAGPYSLDRRFDLSFGDQSLQWLLWGASSLCGCCHLVGGLVCSLVVGVEAPRSISELWVVV